MTVAASNAPPMTQTTRLARRVVQIIAASAHTVQNIETDAGTSIDCDMSTNSYGTTVK